MVIVHRFGCNQHQPLTHKLYKCKQTSAIEDYISRVSQLMDQLTGYEPNPNMLHYTTRFVDGLKFEVLMIILIQCPRDINVGYIGSLQKEVDERVATSIHSFNSGECFHGSIVTERDCIFTS